MTPEQIRLHGAVQMLRAIASPDRDNMLLETLEKLLRESLK